jgi:phosphoglycerol transferase MdoB-like AlkP superfamily enzyme
METPGNLVESLYKRVEVYGKTTYELSKLKFLETTINVVNALVPRLSVIIMISLFALVLNIGIALLLGELLGKSYYGFFIVAGFYLAAAIVLHFFLHKWIKKPISDLIIKQALQYGKS